MIDRRAAAILALRDGRFDGQRWTLDQVAKHFGLSRERVRHIESKANRELARSPGGGAMVTYRMVKMPDGCWLPDPIQDDATSP